ncbi:MAG: YIP1 family protein [Pseudomonadota bacterium]
MGDAAATAPRGLAARVAAAWKGGFRASMARELAEDPGEPRLLAYAMGGCAALWLARLPEALMEERAKAAAGLEAMDPLTLATVNLVSMLFFTPLFLYALAALMRLALQAAGGTGGWKATRTVVFWSPVAAAPAILAGAAASFLLKGTGVAPALAGLPAQAAGLAWAWIWSAGLAEAHGFRSAWPIFAAVAALAALLALAEPGVLTGRG